ncbi:hypothetical protein AMTR_s00052p00213660 [Amborella trichopoda]|uniref:C2H2-type domain-containing protein n=1 Tax=Amborella trichopoda TaxID=13333 RepID=U5D2J5_AMBTC|nr:hypothetical protein AMTR_s00052p00213660 [Amborella trichopoda]
MSSVMKIHQRDQRQDGRHSEKTRQYRCRICVKAFEKYQAVGGNQTSLTKPRKRKGEKEVQKHQCWMCSNEFDMGQALGGHMRRHRKELSRWKAQKLLEQSFA